MTAYTYHSPLGPRQLFADGVNEDGTVDLLNADGVLEIGKCPICENEGGCSISEKSNDYRSFTKKELVDHAESIGLDTTGLNKQDLIECIQKSESETAPQ